MLRARQGRRPLLVVLALGALALMLGGPAGAASSSTLVSFTSMSTATIDTTLCATGTPGITEFGTVFAGTASITSDDCTVTFGATSNTSMLRVSRTGVAETTAFRVPDGPLDPDYAASGVRNAPAGDEWRAATALMDGDLVAAGRGACAPCDMLFRRYDASGSEVASGAAGYPGSSNNPAFAVVGLSDGGFALAGYANLGGTGEDIQIQRYDAANALELSFSGDGRWTDPVAGNQVLHGIAEQSDGSLIGVGYDAGGDWLIVRVTPAGSLDTGFGGGGTGRIHEAISAGTDRAYAVAVQPDDSIIVVGSHGSASDIVVARYTPDGLPDTSFDDDGFMTIAATTTPGLAGKMGVTLQDDGHIVLGAHTSCGGDRCALVARITPDGDLDPSFSGGAPTFDLDAAADDIAVGVAIDRAGLLYVSGQSGAGNGLVGMRLLPDGQLDDTFDSDGVVNFALTATSASGYFVGPMAPVPAPGGGVVFLGHNGAAQVGSSTVPDFESGVADWTTGSDGLFGACLRAVEVDAVLDGSTWAEDTVDADCADEAADPWNGFPADASDPEAKIAGAASTATTSVHLRFGVDVAPDQEEGAYLAPITFEVISPNV